MISSVSRSLKLPRPASPSTTFSCCRPPVADRRFVSEAVERTIEDVTKAIADPELAWLFSNCLPNTLDTTVTLGHDAAGRPDAFVITGDIPAMWLRDSTNQVWPYLTLVKGDADLLDLFRGLINRQAACVRLDPYANAFYRESDEVGHWESDHTEMQPGVHERKYELDSLCAVLRLACGFYFETGDSSCFDSDWLKSIELILQTIRHEQAGSEEQGDTPVYQFRRTTPFASDTLTNQGRGNPFTRTGMSRSTFRPSDDATTFQHLVPANAMAVVGLRDLVRLLNELKLAPHLATDAAALADEIDAGIRQHALIKHPVFDTVFAYEVDGYGGITLMDDANMPGL
ncbi:MAG: Tat pathway signal protein, partial [Phycisphaerales bacterium]|nr:Tat pathway signal protein [Phycisphaerales bacterium]